MRTLLKYSFMVFAIQLCLLVPGSSDARRGVVLAEDYPYAAIFMSMARRAELDHAARTGSFAPDLDTLVAGGYTAYHFPPGFQPDIAYDDDNATITCWGRSIHTMNHDLEPVPYGCGNPHGEWYEVSEQLMPEHGDAAGEWKNQEVKAWKFRGAEWLDGGCNWDTVEQAQRFDRVTQHLVMASSEYSADNYGMPVDLADLEDYIGVPRNDACWNGLNIVNFLDEVELAAGNLFIGWAGDEWVIMCNLGPEIYTEIFVERNGVWTFTRHGGLIWY